MNLSQVGGCGLRRPTPYITPYVKVSIMVLAKKESHVNKFTPIIKVKIQMYLSVFLLSAAFYFLCINDAVEFRAAKEHGSAGA